MFALSVDKKSGNAGLGISRNTGMPRSVALAKHRLWFRFLFNSQKQGRKVDADKVRPNQRDLKAATNRFSEQERAKSAESGG